MRLMVFFCVLLAGMPAHALDLPNATPDQLQKAVDNGDRAAMCELGNRMLRGRNAPTDIERGKALVQQSADLGFADCEYSLGSMYKDGRWLGFNAQRAQQWLLRASSQGQVFAQVELGLIYEKGLGDLTPDRPQALNWYRKAARQWHPVGMFRYGRLLLQDADQSAEGRAWLQLAAEKGDFDAQTLLATLKPLQGSDVLLYERSLVLLRSSMPRTTP